MRVKAMQNDSGVTLIETMIAVLVALIGVFSVGTVIFQATVTNKNQGTEVTRATIYAQDKMELLLSLDFASCNQTASSQPASCNTTGISATGWTQGLLPGGAIAPNQKTCPSSGTSVGYVDFLDIDGNQLTGASCADLTTTNAYTRMWQIRNVSTDGPYQKQVTVAVWSQAAIGQSGQNKPVVILTSYLSNSGTCSAAEKTAGCQY